MQPTSKESPPGDGTRSNAIMDAENAKRSDARSQAEDRFAKITRRDAEVRAYQQQQWDEEAVKIAKLRALRLAREAESKSRPAPKKTAHAARARTAKPA
jgi:hypothetical protein